MDNMNEIKKELGFTQIEEKMKETEEFKERLNSLSSKVDKLRIEQLEKALAERESENKKLLEQLETLKTASIKARFILSKYKSPMAVNAWCELGEALKGKE